MAIRITDLRTQGDYPSLDDRMLVLDFQAGQPEAFVEIHRRYGPLAKHVCHRFLQNRHDADEAFQETMIRVFQGLHRFNGQYALQPWIARIATNVSLDQLRTRSRRPLVDDEALEDHERRDPADGPEEAVERLVERDLVLSVLAGLPQTHRTALVLRELEGQSHKEIAKTLDITPSQAKALIHRAKGSFRRGWLLAITEKGGLTGIAMIPFLWAAKVLDGARKVADRIGGHATTVVQAATPEVVSSAASSPATVTTAVSMTERVVAAGMTILVAGGVTVGAATIVKHRADREQPADRTGEVAAPVAPVIQEQPEADPTAVGPAREDSPRVKPSEDPAQGSDDPAVVPPIDDPTATPSPDPSPDPSPTDDPSATPSPPVVVAPAPDWSYAFTASTESVESCDCDGSTSVSGHRIERSGDGGFTFAQVIRGAAADAAGDFAWPFSLQQWGEVGGSEGRVDLRVRLESTAGDFLYAGQGALAEVTELDTGATAYRFEGTYSLTSGDETTPGLPIRGFVSLTVTVWTDGTIYAGSLSLSDAQV